MVVRGDCAKALVKRVGDGFNARKKKPWQVAPVCVCDNQVHYSVPGMCPGLAQRRTVADSTDAIVVVTLTIVGAVLPFLAARADQTAGELLLATRRLGTVTEFEGDATGARD